MATQKDQEKSCYYFVNCFGTLLNIGHWTCILPQVKGHRKCLNPHKLLCLIVHFLVTWHSLQLLSFFLQQDIFRHRKGSFRMAIDLCLIFTHFIFAKFAWNSRRLGICKSVPVPKSSMKLWQKLTIFTLFGVCPPLFSFLDNFEKYLYIWDKDAVLKNQYVQIASQPVPLFFSNVSHIYQIPQLGSLIDPIYWVTIVINTYLNWILYFSIFYCFAASFGVYEISRRYYNQEFASPTRNIGDLLTLYYKMVETIDQINSVSGPLVVCVFVRLCCEFCGVFIHIIGSEWYYRVLISRQIVSYLAFFFLAAKGFQYGKKCKLALLLKDTQGPGNQSGLSPMDLYNIKNMSNSGLNGSNCFTITESFIGSKLNVCFTFVIVMLQFLVEKENTSKPTPGK